MGTIDYLTHSIAKITCPRLTNVLTRDRLLDLLSGEETRPVKWIQGPPGSGKTTLAADFVNTFQLENIWYRVDETDANISAFFNNLKLAVEKATQDENSHLPLLTPEHGFNRLSFAREFFKILFAAFSSGFTLVLDDFHLLPADSEFYEIVRLGIEEAPRGATIIIISRGSAAPPCLEYCRQIIL